MKKIIYINMMILLYLFIMTSETLANEQNPIVDIHIFRGYPNSINVGESLDIYSFSYDPDDDPDDDPPFLGIVHWLWIIDGEPAGESIEESHIDWTFEEAGIHTVQLYVQDNDHPDPDNDPWFGPAELTVYVNKVAAPFWWWYGSEWDYADETMYVSLNEPFYISANGNPCAPNYDTYFPPGEPTWSIIKAPEGVDIEEDIEWETSNSGYTYFEDATDEIDFNNGISVPGPYTIHVQAGQDDTGADITVVVLGLNIIILNPDTLDEQPWDVPIEQDKGVAFKIFLPEPIENLSSFSGTIGIATAVNSTDGYNSMSSSVELNGDDSLSSYGTEITVKVTLSELINDYLVRTELDNMYEYCSIERGSTNYNDSIAFEGFESGVFKYKRSPARDSGNWTGTDVTIGGNTLPAWSASANDAYVCMGGAMHLTVGVTLDGASVYDNGMYRNTCDTLYISAHGTHSTGKLSNTISASDVDWANVDIVTIAGCSILDIGDLNGNFPTESPPSNPGLQWAQTGPSILLGYNYYAPADDKDGFPYFTVKYCNISSTILWSTGVEAL